MRMTGKMLNCGLPGSTRGWFGVSNVVSLNLFLFVGHLEAAIKVAECCEFHGLTLIASSNMLTFLYFVLLSTAFSKYLMMNFILSFSENSVSRYLHHKY